MNIKRLIECFFYYNLLVYIKNSGVMSLRTFQAPYNHKLDEAIECIRPSFLPDFVKNGLVLITVLFAKAKIVLVQ